MLVLQFLTHQAEQMVTEAGDFLAQGFEAFIGNFADADCFQCLGGTAMDTAADRIQAQQFTGEMKANDLFLAFLVSGERLEGTVCTKRKVFS